MTTNITTNLRAVVRKLDTPIVWMFAVVNIMVIIAAGASIGRYSPEQVIAALPTPSLPIILIATAPPIVPTPAAQVEQVSANVTRAALIAYDAPDGHTLGAIEPGRTYQVLASYGAAWLQANVTGSGVVWLKADQLLGMPSGLVDLAPTATAVVIVREAPAAPAAASYQVDAAPTPATCYHSERQAMVLGVSVGVGIGDSCVSQQLADQEAARQAFGMMNAALSH